MLVYSARRLKALGHGGGEHAHDHAHGDPADASALLGGMGGELTEANLRGVMEVASKQGLPTDYFLGFLFEELLNENAAKQIKQCAPALRELFAACPDKRRTQWTILEGVVNLVTSPKHPSWLLKKTPVIHILLEEVVSIALYDIDMLEEDVVILWSRSRRPAHAEVDMKVREAAAPFIKWLREAEVEP